MSSIGFGLDGYTRVLIAIFVVGGAVVGASVLPEDWALWRRLLAGVMGGAFCSLCVAANRLIAG